MPTKTKAPTGLDRAAKALGHRYRLDALRVFNERAQASPIEVAREIGVDIGLLAHHIRVLRECDYIELVGTEQRRGATEHFYRATRRANITNELAAVLPQSIRDELTVEPMAEIFRRAAKAIDGGTFDRRTNRHVSWMPLKLDEQGWAEMIQLKAEMLEREIEIKDRAAERMIGTDEPPVLATTVSLCFEMPPETT